MENTQEAWTELQERMKASLDKIQAEKDGYLEAGLIKKVPVPQFDKSPPEPLDLKEAMEELVEAIKEDERDELGSDASEGDSSPSPTKVSPSKSRPPIKTA